jgi:hypothetical protein
MNDKSKNEEINHNRVGTMVVPIATAIIGAIGLIIAGIVGGVIINNTIINNYQTPTSVVITATPILTPEITPEPIRQFIDQITIPSLSDTGITFTAPQSGEYIFQYAAGVVYPDPSNSETIWEASVVGFSGEQPEIGSDGIINLEASLFMLSSVHHATKQEAIQAILGQEATLNLNAGEIITLVYSDVFYDDNAGDISLNIYYIPN